VEAVFDIIERVGNERKGGVMQNISVLRILRILRVVRVVRVIRVMKFFREMRIMVYSIIGSMKNLCWIMIILGVTLYLFSIVFTSGLTSELNIPEKWVLADNQPMIEHFGTIDKSILTLYMAMTGGDDWAVFYNSLASMPPLYRCFFLLFIFFVMFAIVNIVTGVFVESALQSNLKDRDIIAHEELQAKKIWLESMQEIFEDMDHDDQGTISLCEFEKKLADDRVIAYFNALKLDVSDARVLFQLLDADDSGEITIDEFMVGVYKLHGESRALDIKIMTFEVGKLLALTTEMREISRDLQDNLAPALGIQNWTTRHHKELRTYQPFKMNELIDREMRGFDEEVIEAAAEREAREPPSREPPAQRNSLQTSSITRGARNSIMVVKESLHTT
jgi:hypothetical protein